MMVPYWQRMVSRVPPSANNGTGKERGNGMVEFRWEDDWEVGSHVQEFDCYDAEPDTCEMCLLIVNGQVEGALGCIDDATDEYRRQVERELLAGFQWEIAYAYLRAYGVPADEVRDWAGKA